MTRKTAALAIISDVFIVKVGLCHLSWYSMYPPYFNKVQDDGGLVLQQTFNGTDDDYGQSSSFQTRLIELFVMIALNASK